MKKHVLLGRFNMNQTSLTEKVESGRKYFFSDQMPKEHKYAVLGNIGGYWNILNLEY